MAWHRHLAAKWLDLPETVERIKQFGPYHATQGPFKYCEICKCVPTTFTAETPEEKSDA
jgi:hypothetical protein